MKIERGLVKPHAGHIHYRAAGSGPPVVLLHINQQSSALFLELMEVLAPALRTIAIDYPGHGMSDHVSNQPSIHDYACCVVEVMDALGLQKSGFLGEATGAVVATELAASFPERTDRVVLVNCPYYHDRSASERAHSPLKASRPADASGFPVTRTIEYMLQHDPVHAPAHPTQSWMDRINVAQMEAGRDRWQALNALAEYDLAGNLARVRCPGLLLMGEHFHYVQMCGEFAARIDSLQVDIIRGGRFCMTWEYAQEIGRRTREFMHQSAGARVQP